MKLCIELHPDLAIEDQLMWLGCRLPKDYQDIVAGAERLLPQELEKRLQFWEAYLRNTCGMTGVTNPSTSTQKGAQGGATPGYQG